MSTIILDFDRTLFDTDAFKKTIDAILLASNIPEVISKNAEEIIRTRYKNYGLIEHIEEINKLGGNVPGDLLDSFFQKDLSSFLFEGSKNTLEYLKKCKHTLVILSKGFDYFQRFKIRQSGIESYFGKHIYICEDNKEDHLVYISQKDKVYFVNDNVEETLAVLKVFPKIQCVLIKGIKTKIDRVKGNRKIKIVDSVAELKNYIKK